MSKNLHERCAVCCESLGSHRFMDSACPERDDLLPVRITGHNDTQKFVTSNKLIVARGETLYLDLSFGQQTALGRIVGDVYYNSRILSLIEHSGYPHNGGEHTLCISGTKEDLGAVLDLIVERFKVLSRHTVAIIQLQEIKKSVFEFSGKEST